MSRPTKVCKVCGETKYWSAFHKGSAKCKQCDVRRREVDKARRNRKRLEVLQWVDSYKAMVGCFVCGEKDPIVLEFHHMDKDKKDQSVSVLVARGAPLIVVMAEAKKCKVVCANDHRRIHHQELLDRGVRRLPVLPFVRNTLSDDEVSS